MEPAIEPAMEPANEPDINEIGAVEPAVAESSGKKTDKHDELTALTSK